MPRRDRYSGGGRGFYGNPVHGTRLDAYNDWLADAWLSKYNHDGVSKGSITIAHQDPAAPGERRPSMPKEWTAC